MVTKGKIRGNGHQLGKYLVAKKDNSHIEILEANGVDNPDADYMQEQLRDWTLLSELSKSDKGLYHASINPAYGEDNSMDWRKAADMMGKEMGYDGQPRVIVLHTKHGRTHAHVVWQRYNTDTGKLIPNEFSRLKQNRARQKMEFAFNHEKTATRNPHIPELKTAMTDIWHSTKTGAEFIAEAEKRGYKIAAGAGRNPFVVIDKNGQDVNLPRYIEGARIKDIRQRLDGEKLLPKEQAIAEMRRLNKGNSGSQKPAGETVDNKGKTHGLAEAFAENRGEILQQDKPPAGQQERQAKMTKFIQSGRESGEPAQTKQQAGTQLLAQNFAANRTDIVSKEDERERRKQELIRQQKEAAERARMRKTRRIAMAALFMLRLVFSRNEFKALQAKNPPSPLYLWYRTAPIITQPPDPKSISYGDVRPALRPTT